MVSFSDVLVMGVWKTSSELFPSPENFWEILSGKFSGKITCIMSSLTKHVENEAEGSPLSKKNDSLERAVTDRTLFCRHPLQLAGRLLHPNER